MTVSPNIVVIAGPNGSGKTTAAPVLLRDYLGLTEFVNADTIAQGLSGFDVEGVAMRAGRIMLARLRELAEAQADFAFETTLASQSFAPWLKELRGTGYRVHLLFLWLASPEMAVARVRTRVEQGGHHVADEVVRRRYHRGLRNFFRIYRPVVDEWMMFDNSGNAAYELIAAQVQPDSVQVVNHALWKALEEQYA